MNLKTCKKGILAGAQNTESWSKRCYRGRWEQTTQGLELVVYSGFSSTLVTQVVSKGGVCMRHVCAHVFIAC